MTEGISQIPQDPPGVSHTMAPRERWGQVPRAGEALPSDPYDGLYSWTTPFSFTCAIGCPLPTQSSLSHTCALSLGVSHLRELMVHTGCLANNPVPGHCLYRSGLGAGQVSFGQKRAGWMGVGHGVRPAQRAKVGEQVGGWPA